MGKVKAWQAIMVMGNHREEGNQSGHKDNMDEVYFKGQHIKFEVNGKKGNIDAKTTEP